MDKSKLGNAAIDLTKRNIWATSAKNTPKKIYEVVSHPVADHTTKLVIHYSNFS